MKDDKRSCIVENNVVIDGEETPEVIARTASACIYI